MSPEKHNSISSAEATDRKSRETQLRLFGRRYEGACLSKICIEESAATKLCGYLENPKNILVFLGNPGVGKTYFCAALIPWAVKKFDTIRVWHEDKLLQTLRDKISAGDGDYFKHLELMTDDELVIVDDIGCNKPNDWREEVLFELINLRYNAMLPTVFTSNLSREDFERLYHPRVASRLFASENTIVELHGGEDLRLSGK